MLASELIMGIIMGSSAVFLCLCLLTTSVVLYLRRRQTSIRQHGIPRWLAQGSDLVSECEKGGVESVGLLEVCEKEWGHRVTDSLPSSVLDHARRIKVQTAFASEGVKDVLLVDVSEKKETAVVIPSSASLLQHDDESPIDPVAFYNAFSTTPTPDIKKPTQPYRDSQLEEFDFDQFLNDSEVFESVEQLDLDFGDSALGDSDFDSFLNNPEDIPRHTPSAPTPYRPSLNVTRKSKRSWESSSLSDVNFGSMQVKGIREIREDRPRQEY